MNYSSLLEKNWKLILGLFGAAIVIAGAAVVMSTRSVQKEKAAQEAYFATEKKLVELKAMQTNPANKTPVDFSAVKTELEKVTVDYPKTVAAQMAALHLAQLLVLEKKSEEALALLEKTDNGSNGLVNTLVQQQIGQLLADKGQCAEAIVKWQKIIDRKQAVFIHADTKIQQALCYTQLNDLKKAEEILTNLANEKANPEIGNSSSAKEAEKYLRLIQFKKVSGT